MQTLWPSTIFSCQAVCNKLNSASRSFAYNVCIFDRFLTLMHSGFRLSYKCSIYCYTVSIISVVEFYCVKIYSCSVQGASAFITTANPEIFI